MTKVSVYDLISDTGPFHRINLNLFCSGGVTTFPAGARYPSRPPHLLHNSRSLSVAPRPLDKTSWARGPEQDFYCVELYILVRAPSRSSHSDFRWPLPPNPTKGSSAPYFRSGEYLVSDSLEPPGAIVGVEEHRGGERKTKCGKFWKSSEGFTGRNQRRIRGSPEGLPARYPSRLARGRFDPSPG